MSVVKSERMTQDRVIALFRDEEKAGDSAEMSGKMSGKTSGKRLGKTAKAIVDLMTKAPEITIPEIAEKLSRSERAIELQINKLKDELVIGRVGPAKGGHWEVLK
jgi:ATP-dependent DNA helicase RecG